MNKAAIKAELRRSACEDKNPWPDCGYIAFDAACNWKDVDSQWLCHLPMNDLRTFFLLVAEAL